MRSETCIRGAFTSLLAATAVIAACLLALPSTALAYQAVEIELPVSVVIDGNLPDEPESFEVVLTPANEWTPMPGGATGSHSITVESNGAAAFPAISYDQPNIWTYTVAQTAGTNELGIYDTTEYAVTVSITNENGVLSKTVAVHAEEDAQKVANIEFVNSYTELLPSTDGDDPSSGGSIKDFLSQTGDKLGFVFAGLALLAAFAAFAVVMAFKRSKIQRAGHRR